MAIIKKFNQYIKEGWMDQEDLQNQGDAEYENELLFDQWLEIHRDELGTEYDQISSDGQYLPEFEDWVRTQYDMIEADENEPAVGDAPEEDWEVTRDREINNDFDDLDDTCLSCGCDPCECDNTTEQWWFSCWRDRLETINTLMNTSNFDLSELEEMSDQELKDLYDGLETDTWLEDIDREERTNNPNITEAMVQPEPENEYVGTRLMRELAEELGTEVKGNKIEYNGQTINFYSETEKFHIGKEKFDTVEDVVEYLKGSLEQNDLDLPGPSSNMEPQETGLP